jgi:YidC/Oxa1 family membrane protein insertase
VNPLSLIEDPLQAFLEFLHDPVGLTYGWAIVMLTVCVRIVLIPLFIKQYKSARRLQAVAPQLKELQRKYKGNKQKLQQEMMAFYKEHNVNPFASCLPLLAQLPVFIALYYVLRDFDFADGSDRSFMGPVIPDISLQLTQIGWGAAVIVIIYALSQLLASELAATPGMSKNQRWLMRGLPIVVVLFVFQFPVPSGLVIYWMTTNLWTCGQQLVIKWRIGATPQQVLARTQKEVEEAADDDEVPVPAMAVAGAEQAAPTLQTPRKRRRAAAPADDAAATNGTGPGPEPPAEEPAEDRTPAAEVTETTPPPVEPARQGGASRGGAIGNRPAPSGGQRRRPKPRGGSSSAGNRRPPKKRR